MPLCGKDASLGGFAPDLSGSLGVRLIREANTAPAHYRPWLLPPSACHPSGHRRAFARLSDEPIEVKELDQDMRPNKIILCVDDNELELSVLKFMLSTHGYRVLSATTGQEAIAAFSNHQVDLVLADFAMPQMNGSQLVERLKQISSHVPMILLADPQKMETEVHRADAMVAKKNCSPFELLERIKLMSARKRGPRKGSVRVNQGLELAKAS